MFLIPINHFIYDFIAEKFLSVTGTIKNSSSVFNECFYQLKLNQSCPATWATSRCYQLFDFFFNISGSWSKSEQNKHSWLNRYLKIATVVVIPREEDSLIVTWFVSDLFVCQFHFITNRPKTTNNMKVCVSIILGIFWASVIRKKAVITCAISYQLPKVGPKIQFERHQLQPRKTLIVIIIIP